ncbi:helix-turn-helix domain-containing protein [Burkholderia sp. WAC0059]|uniref:helix-turn-helix domain-containing protein n=1 Tax=Burkholderia sp. WAC0059 TaxID=2066022 RepID=UPI002155E13F|nr:helix-turn-helix transcriptional regulator [Burkholderia sp. WAC0059]
MRKKEDEPPTLAKAVGRAIARHRRAAGLTQEQLSEAVGIAQSSLSHIERGLVTPSLERLAGIAEQLGCRLVDLLAESGNGAADRAARIHAKLSALEPEQQAAVETLVDTAMALAAPSAARRRSRKGTL